jgi:hypothetical protein
VYLITINAGLGAAGSLELTEPEWFASRIKISLGINSGEKMLAILVHFTKIHSRAMTVVIRIRILSINKSKCERRCQFESG